MGYLQPPLLDPAIASENVLRIALTEMTIQGVGSRRVTDALEALCGSKFQR